MIGLSGHGQKVDGNVGGRSEVLKEDMTSFRERK